MSAQPPATIRRATSPAGRTESDQDPHPGRLEARNGPNRLRDARFRADPRRWQTAATSGVSNNPELFRLRSRRLLKSVDAVIQELSIWPMKACFKNLLIGALFVLGACSKHATARSPAASASGREFSCRSAAGTRTTQREGGCSAGSAGMALTLPVGPAYLYPNPAIT